jgi:hypothetical protein
MTQWSTAQQCFGATIRSGWQQQDVTQVVLKQVHLLTQQLLQTAAMTCRLAQTVVEAFTSIHGTPCCYYTLMAG